VDGRRHCHVVEPRARKASVSRNFKRPQRPRATRSSPWLERLGGYGRIEVDPIRGTTGAWT
jgi:hypothetical protein